MKSSEFSAEYQTIMDRNPDKNLPLNRSSSPIWIKVRNSYGIAPNKWNDLTKSPNPSMIFRFDLEESLFFIFIIKIYLFIFFRSTRERRRKGKKGKGKGS